MAITRRITSTASSLFSALEIPPLGWIGDGFTFSLADYESAAEELIKGGKKPVDVHRELGREVGPDAWLARHVVTRGSDRRFEFPTGTVWLPKGVNVKHPMVADKEFAFHEHNRIVAGWWFDRRCARGGQSTIGAWIATKIGYVSQGQPKHSVRNIAPLGSKPIFKTGIHFLEQQRCVGINPYRDFRYIGEFPRRIAEYPEYVDAAVAAIRTKFMRLHEIGATK